MFEFILKHKYQIIFTIILATGIAFCIAGFWVPPLLVPGAALIASALGFWQSAFVVPEVRAQNEEHEQHHEVEMQPITNNTTNNYTYNDRRQVNMLFMGPSPQRPPFPRAQSLPAREEAHNRLDMV